MLAHDFRFDTVQMPLNCFDGTYRSFEQQVLPELGIDSLAVLPQNVAVARGFTPMPAAEMRALRERCAPFAADGHLELFKSTKRYDGAVGRAQHGYPPSAELPL